MNSHRAMATGWSIARAGILTFACLFWLTTCVASSGAAEPRLALVIGNSGYSSLGQLANPKQDVELIAGSLKGAGFEVTKLLDVDLLGMRRAITDFGRKLRETGAVGLFYYAGHGVQINGRNYLVPVDANIKDEAEVSWQTVDVTEFLKVMERTSSTINIVILDACRDNPFASKFRSASRGLARVDAPRGTFIAYSTAPGDVAQDGPPGANSPYATALARMIQRDGLTLENTFKETRREVLVTTASRQTPWEASSITGEFKFKEGSAAASGSSIDDLRKRLRAQEELIERLRRQGAGDASAASAAPDPASGEQCDRLAASPHDHIWRGERAPFNRLRSASTEAVEACKRAVSANPTVDRYMYQLGRAYSASNGKDIEAVHWFRKAAEKYYPAAMNALGVYLNHGVGVKQDFREAKSWFERAAEKGDPVAMANLAGPNFSWAAGDAALAAAHWARKSAEAQDPVGMVTYARLLMFGFGVPQDLALSYSWLERAASSGNAEAYVVMAEVNFRLGQEHYSAQRKRIELLKKAAGLGHRGAMMTLWSETLVASVMKGVIEADHWAAAAANVPEPWSSKSRERIYILGVFSDEAGSMLNSVGAMSTFTIGNSVYSLKSMPIYGKLLEEIKIERER